MIRVLIVDDDHDIADIHREFVNRTAGFSVVAVAHSGHEAHRALQETKPDLALLDIYLPDRNGLDVLREWRAHRVTTGVIVITAARDAPAVRTAMAGGALRYLIKPFDYEDLAQALRDFRAQHDSVNAITMASQEDVDRLFGARKGRVDPGENSLPKGISAETAALVRAVLTTHSELSAAVCAEETGVSRVSVRRYLEYFVKNGIVSVRLEYGRAGRPTRYYRLLSDR